MKWTIKVGDYYQRFKVGWEVQGEYIYLKTPYHRALLDELRAMDGSKWDKESRRWSIKDNERNRYAIKLLSGFKDDNINRYYHSSIATVGSGSRDLFAHQIRAIAFILTRRRCMLAYEMGLGKTLVGIEVMERMNRMVKPEGLGSLRWWLVAPYGAQQEWKRQLISWDAQCTFEEIVTYESLYKLLDQYDDPPQGVIFDESVKIKTPSARRSQVANELCRLVRDNDGFILLFSGAPAPKEPTDWWHQIECIQPGFIREGNVHKFRNRYADIVYEDGEYGTYPKVIGWKHEEISRLGRRLAPIVLCETKDNCYDLPAKFYDQIDCPFDDQTAVLASIYTHQAATAIEALEALRELSDGFRYTKDESGKRTGITWIGSPKLDRIRELLDFYSQENGGPGRLIIYAAFRASIAKIKSEITNPDWHTGSDRSCVWYPVTIDGGGWSDENILEKFNTPGNDNIVIIANPACVHGLTLTATQALVYYSNSFSVDHRIQSEDRRDRPGMDKTKGTRIIDLIHLPTDALVLTKLKQGKSIQSITLKEIQNEFTRTTISVS